MFLEFTVGFSDPKSVILIWYYSSPRVFFSNYTSAILSAILTTPCMLWVVFIRIYNRNWVKMDKSTYDIIWLWFFFYFWSLIVYFSFYSLNLIILKHCAYPSDWSQTNIWLFLNSTSKLRVNLIKVQWYRDTQVVDKIETFIVCFDEFAFNAFF